MSEESIDLGKNKRVSVSQFKGRTLIDIREFYEASGKLLPGKKGISLNVEAWKKLVESVPEIEKWIRKAEDSESESVTKKVTKKEVKKDDKRDDKDDGDDNKDEDPNKRVKLDS